MGKAGAWSIRVDTSVDNGCFAIGQFEGGTAFRIGFDMRDKYFFIVFGDDNWKSIEYGKNYPVALTFGNQSPWSGTATGMSFDPPENQPFLFLSIDLDQASTFLQESMQERLVVANYNGKEIVRLSLKDSYKAGLELLACQAAMNEAQEDPFQTPPEPSDPFERPPTSGQAKPTASGSSVRTL